MKKKYNTPEERTIARRKLRHARILKKEGRIVLPPIKYNTEEERESARLDVVKRSYEKIARQNGVPKRNFLKTKQEKKMSQKKSRKKYKKNNTKKIREDEKMASKRRKLKEYGVINKSFKEILIEQNNSCKICKTNQDDLSQFLHIDHDHNTNKFRGLLCVNCNTLLANAKDDIEILLKAIEYLKNTK